MQTKRTVLFVISPNLGIVDSWLPIIVALKQRFTDFGVIAVFTDEAILRQVKDDDLLVEGTEGTVDKVIYRLENCWYASDSLKNARDQYTAQSARQTQVSSDLRRLLTNIVDGCRLKSSRRKDILKATGEVQIVLYDISVEKQKLIRELQVAHRGAAWFSLPHGIDERSQYLTNRRKLGYRLSTNRPPTTLVYLQSNSEVDPYIKYYGLDKRQLKVVGVPRHSQSWVDEIMTRTNKQNLPKPPFIFIASRPSSQRMFPRSRKMQSLKHVKRLSEEVLNCRVVIRRHPKEIKEREERLFEEVFGKHAYGKKWEYSSLHPFVLGQSALFCVSLFSSIAIDMVSIGVPVIEPCDFSGLPKVPQFTEDGAGGYTSMYQKYGFALSAQNYEQLRLHALNIITNRNEVINQLSESYLTSYHKADKSIEVIVRDIEQKFN